MKRIRKIFLALFVTIAFTLSISFSMADPLEASFEIHFLDVGQADAVIVICDGKVLMIDGGNTADSSLVFSYLQNTLGVSHIDYMVSTHPHEDHVGGLSGALNACTVGDVFSPVLAYASEPFNDFIK